MIVSNIIKSTPNIVLHLLESIPDSYPIRQPANHNLLPDVNMYLGVISVATGRYRGFARLRDVARQKYALTA